MMNRPQHQRISAGVGLADNSAHLAALGGYCRLKVAESQRLTLLRLQALSVLPQAVAAGLQHLCAAPATCSQPATQQAPTP